MSARPSTRSFLTAGTAAVGALALTLAGASAAHAHVTVGGSTDEAGAYAILTFAVPHGCGDAPTTQVAIQIPEGVSAVTPTRNPFYDVTTIMQTLDTPVTDGHGHEVTERVGQVVYSATTPLPSEQRDAFELSVQLPADAAGTTLAFPTVQTCGTDEIAWVQLPADGQDPHELDAPAPALAITAAGAQAADPLPIIALVIGGLGLIVGALALIRGRKTA